jgi:NAD+ synthase (glutamine-hydrolysing)
MKLLRVAAATLNQTPLDWVGNQRRIAEALGLARARNVGLLCLPELCITGYGCEDAFLAPDVQKTALSVLAELLPHTAGLVACVGLPLAIKRSVFNACCLMANRKILGFVAKRALAGDGIHYEPRWFKPWPKGRRTQLRCCGFDVKVGDLVFDIGGIRVGFEICEDAWSVERPAAELALQAVDVILNPSASHFAFDKHAVRRRLVSEGSRAFGVSYVYANLLGNEAGRIIYDGDTLIASGGKIVSECHRFSYAEVQLIDAVVDVELTRSRYAQGSSYQPYLLADDEAGCVVVDHVFPTTLPERKELKPVDWENSANLKYEEFTRALCLGLFDYLRKSRSCGFVVSLSGGADSSALSCLVALLVRLGQTDLGAEEFAQRLKPQVALSARASQREWIHLLLTTVYQSTRNSSNTTREAARSLAAALGANHLELDVDSCVSNYQKLVAEALGRELSWEHDDLALQNIQARARAPGVWMIANLTGALLLATSNRSEAAVGYATMDGDTAGGLSPIAGIDKAFIRRWLVWLRDEGPAGIGRIPELSVVTSQVPTAELRPCDAEQTDEGDLMPYDLLDAIERAAIRDKRSPLDVLLLMQERFKKYEVNQLATWVERFFRLWARNQWKRERYAPSFHVDDANLDPKTWCRFPILSGGFERELAQMQEYLLKPPGTL